jgi:ribonuclease HI
MPMSSALKYYAARASISKDHKDPALDAKQSAMPKPAKASSDAGPEAMPIEAWTDGSALGNPGPGGWGWAVWQDGAEIAAASGSYPAATNNQMEIEAATRCLQWVQRHRPSARSVKLCSDSKYVVDGCNAWIQNWKRRGWKKSSGNPVLNRDRWEALDQEINTVRATATLDIVWVKAHAGIARNERVDGLARTAAEQQTPEQQTPEHAW